MSTDPLAHLRWLRAPRSPVFHLFAAGVGAECGHHTREIPTSRLTPKHRYCRACQDVGRALLAVAPAAEGGTP